jgi:hypothetical protein
MARLNSTLLLKNGVVGSEIRLQEAVISTGSGYSSSRTGSLGGSSSSSGIDSSKDSGVVSQRFIKGYVLAATLEHTAMWDTR